MTELTNPTGTTNVVEQTETTELVVLVQNSGLPEDKRPAIITSLESFFKKASEWDKTISTIVINSPEQVNEMKVAGTTRLALKNMRLEAKDVVEAKREAVKNRMANDVLEDKLWLKSWQMIEAIYKNLESKCEEKEKFKERWEAQEKETRKTARIEQLKPYVEDVSIYNLGDLSEPAFIDLFEGSKLLYENKQKKIKEEQDAADKLKKEAEEKLRVQKLSDERRMELLRFGYDYEADDLGKLEESEYQKVLTTTKATKEKKDNEAKQAQLKSERINTRLNLLLSLGMKFEINDKTYHGYNIRINETQLSDMEEADWSSVVSGIEKAAAAEKQKISDAQKLEKDNIALNNKRINEISTYMNYGPEIGDLQKLYTYSEKEWKALMQEKSEAFAEEQEKTVLQSERLAQLLPYNSFGADVDMTTLWVYTPERWEAIYEGKKAAYESFHEAAKVKQEPVETTAIPLSKDDRTDEQKLRQLVNDFVLPECKLLTKEGVGVYTEMVKKLDGFKRWAINQISENL